MHRFAAPLLTSFKTYIDVAGLAVAVDRLFRSQCVVLAVRMAGVVVAVTGALVVIFIICVDEVTIVECW